MSQDDEHRNPLSSPTVVAAIITGIIGIVTVIITGYFALRGSEQQTMLPLTAQAAVAADTATWTAYQINVTMLFSATSNVQLTDSLSLTGTVSIATATNNFTNTPDLAATSAAVTTESFIPTRTNTATASLTTTDTLVPTSSNTPTPNDTERQRTLQIVMANLQTEQARQLETNDRATAIILTATADSWTSTPTPDDRATAAAMLDVTIQQLRRAQSATASIWTSTPMPTLQTLATRTPSPTLLNTQAQPPVSTSAAQSTILRGVPFVLIPATSYHDAYGSVNYRFWIASYETTNMQFTEFLNGRQRFANTTDAGEQLFDDSSNSDISYESARWHVFTGRENEPATFVTWYGAREYCAWLGGQLPSVSEWNKAFTNAGTTEFPWGNDIDLDTRANINYDNINSVSIGNYAPSQLGIYDLLGNVWEWTNTDLGVFTVRVGGAWDSIISADQLDIFASSQPHTSASNRGVRCIIVP